MKALLEQAVIRNLNWFLKSGIMSETSGGGLAVYERIVVKADNDAIGEIKEHFPLFEETDSILLLKHIRPDCCFETGLMFALAGRYFQNASYNRVAAKIFHYLFVESSLLMKDSPDQDVWNWYEPLDHREFWFDDNGWISSLEMLVGQLFPGIESQYHMAASGQRLAGKLEAGLMRCMTSKQPLEHGKWPDPEKYFLGEVRQPHWGIPVITALTMCGGYEQRVRDYYADLERTIYDFSLSEWCYALVGLAAAYMKTGDSFYQDIISTLVRRLYAKADPVNGTLGSEHCEAPAGEQSVDLIYTVNWLMVGLSMVSTFSEDVLAHSFKEKLSRFLLEIQMKSPDVHLDGCYRGMYDLKTRTYGGGNKYEGGSHSVYSGWTNAPITLAMLVSLLTEH